MKRAHRILKNEQFQVLIKKGRLTRTPLCYGYYLANELNTLRVGIAVSKKVGNAPIRNRIKRQIRAIVRPYTKTHAGDFVFVAKKEILNRNFADLAVAIDRIFTENGVKNEKKKQTES